MFLGAFVAVNCAGLTDSLIGSQLFGHRRGAFTGAVEDHQGFLEAAAGGTLLGTLAANKIFIPSACGGQGTCGACTVLIDGKTRYACLTLAVEAQGADIVTVEGLMDGEDLGPTQEAFVEKDAFQCGYCTAGMLMSAYALLLKNPNPTQDVCTQ